MLVLFISILAGDVDRERLATWHWSETFAFPTRPEVAVFYFSLRTSLVSLMLRSQADSRMLLAADTHGSPPTLQTWVLECSLLSLASFEKMLTCSHFHSFLPL